MEGSTPIKNQNQELPPEQQKQTQGGKVVSKLRGHFEGMISQQQKEVEKLNLKKRDANVSKPSSSQESSTKATSSSGAIKSEVDDGGFFVDLPSDVLGIIAAGAPGTPATADKPKERSAYEEIVKYAARGGVLNNNDKMIVNYTFPERLPKIEDLQRKIQELNALNSELEKTQKKLKEYYNKSEYLNTIPDKRELNRFMDMEKENKSILDTQHKDLGKKIRDLNKEIDKLKIELKKPRE